MNNLPNLLIIGVFKAGTTSLFHYLTQHPEIFGASKKETHFFSPLVFNNGNIQDLKIYKSYFSLARNQKRLLEATPSYFYGPSKLIPIFKENFDKNHKLIVILRNPADRIISYFKFLKTRNELPLDESFDVFLNKCIQENDEGINLRIGIYANAIREGYYARYLEEWIKHYSPENLYIIFFEELSDPKGLLIKLSKWLSIDSAFYDKFSFTVENKTITPKFQLIHHYLLKLNMRFENFFRNNPSLKKRSREIYYFFNSRKETENISEESRKKLSSIYTNENKKLKLLVKDYNENLPYWLN
jgi:hypothetical protein